MRTRPGALNYKWVQMAHPLEPYPFYKPRTKKNKIWWLLIKLRWKVIKRVVKYSSPLDGWTKY